MTLFWMIVGTLAVGALAVGIILGVDHGLGRQFFGPTSSALIGWGAGMVGGLLGKVAAR